MIFMHMILLRPLQMEWSKFMGKGFEAKGEADREGRWWRQLCGK